MRRYMRICCETWNAALEQRIVWWKRHELLLDSRSAWNPRGGNDTSLSQTKQLQEARRELDLNIPANTHNAVLIRLDRAFKGLRAHRRAGGHGGFPHFRLSGQWRTLDFPSYGQTHEWLGGTGRYRRIRLRGIGVVLVRQHRPFPSSDFGWATVTELPSGRWMVGINMRSLESKSPPKTGRTIGISRGIDHLIGMSDGRLVKQLEPSLKVVDEFERAQRALLRTKSGSNRRVKAKKRMARTYERAAADRDRQIGELARSLVDEYDEIVLGNPCGPGTDSGGAGL